MNMAGHRPPGMCTPHNTSQYIMDQHKTECNFSNAKLGGVTNTPEGRAAIWWDLDWLEKWAARNFMKFNRGNCEGLQLGKNHPLYPYVPWVTQKENSLAENGLGVLVDTRLNVTPLVDQGKPVDVIFLHFSKVFSTVSHRIHLDKMSSTQLDKHIMGWESNWFMCRAQVVPPEDLLEVENSIILSLCKRGTLLGYCVLCY
ncbi:hypothetical protein BTVI_135306 [Pitangus sulphuratus]|nr:hypothetical protein BTVI_135306 [Pitangus sulphuratus]